MIHNDQDFPIINYLPEDTPKQNGQKHGESFKDGIRELAKIRKDLLINKNPSLKDHLKELALEQFGESAKFDSNLTEELIGLSEGAGLPIEDIVLLNNYTDFRDIQLVDEGCSTTQIKTDDISLSGQTWDMHSSAKNFVCLINIPGNEKRPGQLYFSLVGCLGMMGINTNDLLLGVNNLNTKNAKASLIWPVLIRHAIQNAHNFTELENIVSNAPVTSGHNYLLSSKAEGAMWEVSPVKSEKVAHIKKGEMGRIFHTNHCLGEINKSIEVTNAASSTTHPRFQILEDKINSIKSKETLIDLFHSHTNYPKSICGHFENNSQDPSATCGGGVYDFNSSEIYFWRGCPVYDQNFKNYHFLKKEYSFYKVK